MARSRGSLNFAGFFLVLLVLLGCARSAGGDRALQIASFEYAWTRIRDTYPDPGFRGLDWQALGEELRPEAARARTAAELRPVLEQMFARLGDSHFAVIPGALAPDARAASGAAGGPPLPVGPGSGEIGVDLRLLDDRLIVSRVDPGSPAEAAGVRTGHALISVDGVSVAGVLASLGSAEERRAARGLLLARLTGPVGLPARLELEDGTGGVRVVEVPRVDAGAPWIALGSLPPVPVHFQTRTLEGGVGLIRFDVFMEPVPERFTAAMEGLIAEGVRGIVLDLRGNPGGVAPMAMGMAGHFFAQRGLSLGTLIFRESTWNLLVNPRAARFDGPLAVLVDGLSASTSEIMAAGLQKLGRARVFGEPSAGMALPSTWERLPNGDLIQFVTGDYTAPDGARVERAGVHPDELTPLTRAALLEGRDPALDAARTWISSTLEVQR